jgi:hypothetical protein
MAYSWDQAYGAYADSLRAGNVTNERIQELYGDLSPTFAANIIKIKSDIDGQKKAGTADYWGAGNLASPDSAAWDGAFRLAEKGVGSLYDLRQQDGVTVNTKTGEPLVGFGNAYNHDLDFNLAFNEAGVPILTASNQSSEWVSKYRAPLTAAALLAAGIYGPELLAGAGAAGGAGAGAAGAAELGAGGLLSGAGTAGAGTGLGTGITAGASGLGINAAGASGLGINAGAGLTGTGVLTGSTLGTGLLGTGAAGLAGLTGTGVLTGSTLGTGLLGTTSTGALTGTGILTGSELGTALLGTGPGTAATVGGVGGTLGANLGTGALNTGISTGAGSAVSSAVNAAAGAGAGAGAGTKIPSSLLSGGLTTAAGLFQSAEDRAAAEAAAASINAATKQAVQGAQFRPIGTTTRFGSSQFGYDPTTGQMTSAGYQLSPEARAAQDRFAALANAGITQVEGAQAQFAPLQTGAQSLFNLGNQYLAQSPQDVAQNYINQQMALLQPGRELELANLQNRLQQQGRGGLSVAQGGAFGATTPELQALFNARAQQEALLAANAQQAGQQNVAFGAGLLGTGAQTLGNYYSGQQAAYAPYTNAMSQVTGLETAGQQPFALSTGLANQVSTAGARAGELGLRGAGSAANITTGRAATTDPFAQLLAGLGSNSGVATGIANLFGR